MVPGRTGSRRPEVSRGLESIEIEIRLAIMSDRKSKPKRKPRQRRRNNNNNRVPKRPVLGRAPRMKNVDVKAPVAQAKLMSYGMPQVNPMKNGDARVRHREYITDIRSPGSNIFTPSSFSINPGQGLVFPWLSKIAANYESYIFRSLKFVYQPIAATTTSGTVVIAVDYDARDDPPQNKQQALTYRSAVRGPVWHSFAFTCLPADLHKLKSHFTRTGAQPPATDIKTYDIGNLYVAAIGLSSAIVGELHVEYDVELLTPQYALPTYTNHLGGSLTASNNDATAQSPLGSVAAVKTGSVGFSYDAKNNTLKIDNPGTYMFNYFGTEMQSGSLDPIMEPQDPSNSTIRKSSVRDLAGGGTFEAFFSLVANVVPALFTMRLSPDQNWAIDSPYAYLACVPTGSLY